MPKHTQVVSKQGACRVSRGGDQNADATGFHVQFHADLAEIWRI